MLYNPVTLEAVALLNPPHTLGEKIRWARKRAGLSHDKLGQEAGCTRQHLIRLEQDKHVPGDELLERIAIATGQPVEFFAGTTGQRLAQEHRDRLVRAFEPLLSGLVDELMTIVQEHTGV